MADQKDFFVTSAGEMLRSLGNEGIENVRKIIFKAANQTKDDTVLQWLKIIAETDPQPSFQDWIMSLFWDLPHDSEGYAAVPKSKEWIIREVIGDWKPEQSPATSVRAFLFLLAAYEPTEDRLKACGVSESVWKSFAHSWNSCHWTRGTRNFILDRMRQHTSHHSDYYFAADAIEEWLEVPRIPSEIAEVLLHSWARNGGWVHMQRHLRNAKTLEWFEAENYSESARYFLHKLGGSVKALEEDVARLSGTIPDLWKNAKFYYHEFDRISFTFYFKEDHYSVDEAALVYHQMRIAIKRWITEQKERKGVEFSVYVDFCVGSQATPQFRKAETISAASE